MTTTTKTAPQMQAITSRWLLRMLPWVRVTGGVYRVNRRRTYAVGTGRVSFDYDGATARVVPRTLAELPLLHGFAGDQVLEALAGRFEQRTVEPGEVIAHRGRPRDRIFLVAHGKVGKSGPGYTGTVTREILGTGGYFGDDLLTGTTGDWTFTYVAATRTTVLSLSLAAYAELARQHPGLTDHVARTGQLRDRPRNKQGEAAVQAATGHDAEAVLPGTFVDYERAPREYELSAAQTVLRVSTRAADLYNEPMNQVEQQLRLTIEALREQQEHELVNNPDFGLLHNADLRQRIPTLTGPPTPDDLDELLSRRRKSRFFLAHPRAIAAFGRECTRRRVDPGTAVVDGQRVLSWRGVPVLPCDKIPISDRNTTSILVLRTGEQDEGVIGLHQTGIPDEYQPGLSVRFMGVDDKAIISYLVSTYYSVAPLVPDALGVLEDVVIGR